VVGCIAGIRRVSHVEVVEQEGSLRFYAVGMGHRRPVTVRISRGLAAELAGRVRFVERPSASAPGDLQSVPASLQPVD
jgi:hypothetical protein